MVTAICVREQPASLLERRTRFCPTPWEVRTGDMSLRFLIMMDIDNELTPKTAAKDGGKECG